MKTLNVIADMIRLPFVLLFAFVIIAALVAVTIWDRMHGRKAEDDSGEVCAGWRASYPGHIGTLQRVEGEEGYCCAYFCI